MQRRHDAGCEGANDAQYLQVGFFWQFAGGFVLGATALVSLHPAAANQSVVSELAAATHLAR